MAAELKDVVALIFRHDGNEYRGSTAVEIVLALAADATEFAATGGSVVREFLEWSLARLSDSLPARELGVSDRLGDEANARSYLMMRERYGLGRLLDDEPSDH